MYFERWKYVDEDFWYLDRAYLNIFRTELDNYEERKFLSLHCDPNVPDNAPHAAYKKGPHLHIQVADPPFPHAHISLTGTHLDLVLGSIDSLSKAIKWAVLMLRKEVLNPIK